MSYTWNSKWEGSDTPFVGDGDHSIDLPTIGSAPGVFIISFAAWVVVTDPTAFAFFRIDYTDPYGNPATWYDPGAGLYFMTESYYSAVATICKQASSAVSVVMPIAGSTGTPEAHFGVFVPN